MPWTFSVERIFNSIRFGRNIRYSFELTLSVFPYMICALNFLLTKDMAHHLVEGSLDAQTLIPEEDWAVQTIDLKSSTRVDWQ